MHTRTDIHSHTHTHVHIHARTQTHKHTHSLTFILISPLSSKWQVSSDCSSLFVDGSESGVGSTCVGVEFGLGGLRGSLCLRVWAPAVPLRVSVSDPVLNAIHGWRHRSQHGYRR